LPGNYAVIYPNGASLDKDGKIQIDSNNLMQGGISPDVRIPINMETLKAICVNHRDYALEAAITAMKAVSKN
jgi:carboxyl-terminal processing protease